VLDALDRGLDPEQISEELGISENTLRQLTRRLLLRFPGRVVDLPANARKAGVSFEPRGE
jgi:orotate phosphoribosyltransferase-like protein